MPAPVPAGAAVAGAIFHHLLALLVRQGSDVTHYCDPGVIQV